MKVNNFEETSSPSLLDPRPRAKVLKKPILFAFKSAEDCEAGVLPETIHVYESGLS